MVKIQRALLSVHNKEGIVALGQALAKRGIEILSTGGTAQVLRRAQIPVVDVSTYAGPELLDGRVKTLHPAIHAAILADRKSVKHMQELKAKKIAPIDLVVVNLYPFEQTIGKEHTLHHAIETIDIGGPTLIRAAAKNYGSVAVAVDPADYTTILAELQQNGTLSESTRQALAYRAWLHVAHYDAVIARYFGSRWKSGEFPNTLALSFTKIQDLRYGENPHQRAALYGDPAFSGSTVVHAKPLQGKQLSYNNIQDASAAFDLVNEFEDPTVVIVKHNNPSGVASSADIREAYRVARSVDPEAAFGGVVAINRSVDDMLAQDIISVFVEIVIAPRFSPKAREVFKRRKNLRLLELPEFGVPRKSYWEYRSVPGGLLVQDADALLLEKDLQLVTRRKPSPEEKRAMLYAWKIAKYVKSNAIVYAREHRAVGIGAGQMKRVDAAKLASMIARDYSGPDSLKGCAMASDAFFPFRDGIDYAAKLGITAIIQPGGSIHDAEVIAAANEHHIAMVFTGVRHFRH